MLWLLLAFPVVLLLAALVIERLRRPKPLPVREAEVFLGTRLFGGKPPRLEYHPRDGD